MDTKIMKKEKEEEEKKEGAGNHELPEKTKD